MAGITLEQAQAQLDLWMAASEDIAVNGQSTSIHGRTFTAANLDYVDKQIDKWDTRVKQLTRGTGGMRIRGITPVD